VFWEGKPKSFSAVPKRRKQENPFLWIFCLSEELFINVLTRKRVWLDIKNRLTRALVNQQVRQDANNQSAGAKGSEAPQSKTSVAGTTPSRELNKEQAARD
jgi:hypothetical protein